MRMFWHERPTTTFHPCKLRGDAQGDVYMLNEKVSIPTYYNYVHAYVLLTTSINHLPPPFQADRP
jgi:hypothetical protein